MYSRADLSRSVTFVAALFSTAVSTNAAAREFCAADTRSQDYPAAQALRYTGRLIVERGGDRRHAEAAMACIHARAQRSGHRAIDRTNSQGGVT